MRRIPIAVVIASAILIVGLAFVGRSFFRQREAAYQADAQRERQKKLARVSVDIASRFDSQIIRLIQEGGYCVPRCRVAYRPHWPLQEGNRLFNNSWEMVSEAAALRVLSFHELDAQGGPQFRLLISYGTKRTDGYLQAAEPRFADFLARLMQRFDFPAAYVGGECIAEMVRGPSTYRCKQNRFWWGDFAFDPVRHPSVKTFTTERTITLIRKGPFGEQSRG